jgi:hypothetical protein
MIKAQELRIDNWVQVTNEYLKRIISGKVNKYQQVENVWSFGINISSGYEGSMEAEFNMEDIEGIPLSPSILEKAGFIKELRGKESDFDGVETVYFKSGVDIYDNSVEQGETMFLYATYTRYPGRGFKSGIQVEYLHQLQNLYFALTNEELTINL